MGRRSLVASGVLALILTAAGCGAREDPAATPARSTGASTGAAGTVAPPAGATSQAPAGSATPAAPSASAATLIAFVMVSAASTGGAAEVSGPARNGIWRCSPYRAALFRRAHASADGTVDRHKSTF
jgi:hypothetical protein